jgi:hypothetical protein
MVSIGRPGAMVPIAELTLDNPFSSRWIPLHADLTPWAGQRVTLRMELVPPSPRHEVGDRAEIGYLGSPRIAFRATGRERERSADPES